MKTITLPVLHRVHAHVADVSPARAISSRTVARLAHYRRVLLRASQAGTHSMYSHEIASICDATPAQVRRDLMAVGTLGHPIHGYDVETVLAQLDAFLDSPRGIRMALVGVGNLGRALLSYFARGRSPMTMEAAFDNDPAKLRTQIGGVPVEPLERIATVLHASPVDVGVLAVPEDCAQSVADLLVTAGVRSLLNLAPVRLHVPPGVFVEDVDLGIAIERAAWYGRHRPHNDR